MDNVELFQVEFINEIIGKFLFFLSRNIILLEFKICKMKRLENWKLKLNIKMQNCTGTVENNKWFLYISQLQDTSC